MKKLAVVGTCHCVGIADALMHMLEGTKVIALTPTASFLDAGSELLEGCDWVFNQYLPDEHGPLSTSALKARFPVVDLPVVSFTGFQPDCIYLEWQSAHYASPLGAYNSALVAAAFSLGLPPERTKLLFNAFVYKSLGYFDEHAKSRAFLAEYLSNFGIDLEAEWPLWMANGPFMLSINHPKPVVFASVARAAAMTAGLVAADCPYPQVYFDQLTLEPVWPVYPEIASRYGVAGNYCFKKHGFSNMLNGTGVFLNLQDFIGESYEMYKKYPVEIFEIDMVRQVRERLSTVIA